MKKSSSRTSNALVTVSLALALMTRTVVAGEYNTDKIGDVLKKSRTDFTLVCAHRGLHDMVVGRNRENLSIRNIPENSRAAIQATADNQIECSEIDLRSNRWGDLILLHDTTLGRTTNVGWENGKPDYDPYLGTGYNPPLLEYAHPEKLHLRTPDLTATTPENLPNLSDALDYIKDNRIAMVLFLDIKDATTARQAWTIVKRHKNAWGVPATKWVYFKMNVSDYATPVEFEKLGIFGVASESGSFRFIPVFFPSFIDTSRGTDNALQNWSAYAKKPYVWATELGMKQYDAKTLSYPLNNIMNAYYALRTSGAPKMIGNYQVVPETKNHRYFWQDGHCCLRLEDWSWKSQHDYGEDSQDLRIDLEWIINVAGGSYSYVITDDPLTAVEALKRANRRNTSVIWND